MPSDSLPDNLSAPARRALAAGGITTLAHLTQRTVKEVRALHGIGPMTILQLDRALRAAGLRFKE